MAAEAARRPLPPGAVNPPIVALNGQLVPAGQARVSIFDHGLLYGHGLFETMRAYGGRVFRLEEHLGRLVRGAEVIGIPLGGQRPALERSVQGVLHANGLTEARLRITVTAGEGPGLPVYPAPGSPAVFVTAAPVQPVSKERFEHGLHAVVWGRARSSMSAIVAVKTTDLLENLMARADARQRGADEAIILNERHFIAECSLSNVFFVSRGRLLTPAAECGLLQGITRDVVIQLAAERGLPLDQAWISVDDAKASDEAFVTNSVIELMPLVAIEGRPVGDGRPGPVTRALAKAYRDLVARELGLRQSGP